MEGTEMKLNIGCGTNKLPDYVRIDIDPLVEPDHVLDMNKDKLPYENDSVDEILCSHMIEHLDDMTNFYQECYRVLKHETGRLTVVTPHYLHESSWADPDHVWHIPPKFFQYLDRRCTGSDGRPVVCGEFDFQIVDMVMVLDAETKKKYQTTGQWEFAAKFLANSVESISVVLMPIKPARVMESKFPQTTRTALKRR